MENKMDLASKLSLDALRDTAQAWRVIHLFREGSFYRLFDRSLWLHTVMVYNDAYRNQIGAKQPLSAQKNVSKEHGEFIMGGFPIRSAEKYSGGMEITIVNEHYAQIIIPDEVCIELSEEECEEKFQEFFDSIELKKNVKKERQGEPGAVHTDVMVARRGMIDIMRDILQYQLVEHTPTETMEFLRGIQRELSRLL